MVGLGSRFVCGTNYDFGFFNDAALGIQPDAPIDQVPTQVPGFPSTRILLMIDQWSQLNTAFVGGYKLEFASRAAGFAGLLLGILPFARKFVIYYGQAMHLRRRLYRYIGRGRAFGCGIVLSLIWCM